MTFEAGDLDEGDIVYDRSGYCGVISKISGEDLEIEWNSQEMRLPVRKMRECDFIFFVEMERFRVEKP